MAAPQDPPVRLRQKKARTKKLAQWRAKKAAEAATAGAEKKPAEKPAAAKKPAT